MMSIALPSDDAAPTSSPPLVLPRFTAVVDSPPSPFD
jgi:hypothetical protein